MNVEQVKKNLLNTLDSIDRDKLSLLDLKLYAEILRTVSEIQAKSYLETMTEAMRSTVCAGFNKPQMPTVAEMK